MRSSAHRLGWLNSIESGATCLETFPELEQRPPSAPAKTTGPQRRAMSDAAKQAISIRMKKYWAQRKKTQKR